MTPQFEIMMLAAVVAVACSLCGVFLVLRKVSLMSDAISHAILLGIVLAFFVVKDFASPLLIIGAALTGILTVTLTELIIGTGKLKADASMGLVFPALFSLGVILINLFASKIHLDTDAVLLGEIAFAPFHRMTLFGADVGPVGVWLMGAILLADIIFIALFYKELKLATFDAGLAAALGFSPAVIHYLLMALVSITAVGAFDAVGSILVVALMIAPPATAYLLTQKLGRMIAVSACLGILAAVTGYALAHAFDASIAGSMAMMAGFFFLLALLFAPQKGLLSQLLQHRTNKLNFALEMLMVHLLTHEGKDEEAVENTLRNAQQHMEWSIFFAKKVVEASAARELLLKKGKLLLLTPKGRELARQSLVRT
ncbi:metal ABC transporter permease [Candidatus Woesearchaeota archaeon]|nr:metal ABC transporter permease [Candidatus Woesearchaeota archaeon]